MKLTNFLKTNIVFGRKEGKIVGEKIKAEIEKNNKYIHEISFKGIVFADATFLLESIVLIAKQYKGQRGICVSEIENPDIIFNLNFAAKFVQQPITHIGFNNNIELLGSSLTVLNQQLLNFVIKNKPVSSVQAASNFNLSIQNASAKLKKLVDEGYLLRTEQFADSGGFEYLYQPIIDIVDFPSLE